MASDDNPQVHGDADLVLASIAARVESLEAYAEHLRALDESVTTPARAAAAEDCLRRLLRLQETNQTLPGLAESAAAVGEAQQAVNRL
jgi:hypothetical protein